MSWINEHKNVGRVAVLMLLLVAIMGPWTYTADGVPPAGPLLDATLGAAIGCLLIGSFDPGFGLLITWPAHGWLLALALGSQVVGWLLITTVLPRIPVLETSILLLLQPVLTVIWGLLFFVELLSPLQWLGVILVLGSIATLTLRGNVARRAQPIRLSVRWP